MSARSILAVMVLAFGSSLLGCAPKRLDVTVAHHSTLTEDDRRQLREWKPGDNKSTDERMALLLLERPATAEDLKSCGHRGLIAVWKRVFVVSLPQSFEDNKREVIVWRHPDGDVPLLETGPASLSFSGRRCSDAIMDGQYWDVTLTISAETAAALPEVTEFDGVEEVARGVDRHVRGIRRERFGVFSGKKQQCRFRRLDGRKRTFECPSVNVKTVSSYSSRHEVKITFINGIVARVAVDDRVIEKPGGPQLPRRDLPWQNPDPIGPDDVFGPPQSRPGQRALSDALGA